jgi:hypothetical protein
MPAAPQAICRKHCQLSMLATQPGPTRAKEPIGRVENTVQRIGENREPEPLVGIPARKLPVHERVAQEGTRGEVPVRDIAKEENLSEKERQVGRA